VQVKVVWHNGGADYSNGDVKTLRAQGWFETSGDLGPLGFSEENFENKATADNGDEGRDKGLHFADAEL
jgi:hypothetical protein